MMSELLTKTDFLCHPIFQQLINQCDCHSLHLIIKSNMVAFFFFFSSGNTSCLLIHGTNVLMHFLESDQCMSFCKYHITDDKPDVGSETSGSILISSIKNFTVTVCR